MSQEFKAGLIGVRDWDYLKYRYFNHPEKHYEVFLIRTRFGKSPRGVMYVASMAGNASYWK